jgi:hypothetical protein
VECSVTTSGNTLTVDGKEAGLGDEDQIHIVVSATAECINPGEKHPKAANKESVSAEVTSGPERQGPLLDRRDGYVPAGLHSADDGRVHQRHSHHTTNNISCTLD